MKPYQQVSILECGESLVAIPADLFVLTQPHLYQDLGAPYGTRSPYFLRSGVLERLIAAQVALQQVHPGWRIQIFDAYRPIAVQQFMVDYTFAQVVQEQGLNGETLTDEQRQAILTQVYQFWAVPSLDPSIPPPHSTGAAIDILLVNAAGQALDMGSPIDELSPRSYPEHFAESLDPAEQTYHHHRQVLQRVMLGVGFRQHPHEWWHFSWGDQFWAWLTHQANPEQSAVARYGRVD